MNEVDYRIVVGRVSLNRAIVVVGYHAAAVLSVTYTSEVEEDNRKLRNDRVLLCVLCDIGPQRFQRCHIQVG